MDDKAKKIEIINRCRKSSSYFIENFCKIKHQTIGIIPFKLFKYQLRCLTDFRNNKFCLFKKCRQSGVSTLTGVYALWFTMFHSNKTVLIVSKRDLDAMTFLNDRIKFVYNELPQWMKEIWTLATDNEHTIKFVNGSIVRSLTSSKDTLRSNSSSLNIIDEAAFIPDMDAMWSAGRPTLIHGGSTIVISTCVVGGTYIFTSNGMQKIGDLGSDYTSSNDEYEFKNYSGPSILGCTGLRQPTKYYKRRYDSTKLITTKLGYELEAHNHHRIKVCRDSVIKWVTMEEVINTDYIAIQRGANIFGNDDNLKFKDGPNNGHQTCIHVDTIDEPLAYMIGIIVAEGYINDTHTVVANNNRSLLDSLNDNKYGIRWLDDGRVTHIRCCSTRFVRFLKWLGCSTGRAPTKVIPYRLFSCSKPIISAFLRGLYDGDDHSRTRDGEVGYTSTSRELIKQVRLMLLNYGIICREEYHPPYIRHFKLHGREYHSQCHESWQLIVRSGEASKFYEVIGFGLKYKSANLTKVRPCQEYVPGIRRCVQDLRHISQLSIGELKRRGIHASTLLFKSRKRDLTERKLVDKLIKVLSDYSNYEPYNRMVAIADQAIYWDQLESITNGQAETYDFTIPDDHTFWSNGLISHNTNGIGNWYWKTWTDAEQGLNDFHPIILNWWDMDWVLEWNDQISGRKERIAPTAELRECKTKEEMEKYGKYWSPWLEREYRSLTSKGEGHKFKQEILAEFLGGGGTILSSSSLINIEKTVNEAPTKQTIDEPVEFVDPITGIPEQLDLKGDDHTEGLWIWKEPVSPTRRIMLGGRIIKNSEPGHIYIIGADTATGDNDDYSTVEVFDLNTLEQAAEYVGHSQQTTFAKILYYIGKWYNDALICAERSGVGATTVQELARMAYPNIWRKVHTDATGIHRGQYGFVTSHASKPALNKSLVESLGEDEGAGFKIYSDRLLQQLRIYIRMRNRSGMDTGKTGAQLGRGNHDDLVIATALAFIAAPDALGSDHNILVPTHGAMAGPELTTATLRERATLQSNLIPTNDPAIMMPFSTNTMNDKIVNPELELQRFTAQLVSQPPVVKTVVNKSNKFKY